MPAMRGSVHHATRPGPQWRLLLVVLLVSGWSSPGRAFGPSGHRLAAHIAERELCPETRAALAPLLAGMTLAEAGLWPDTIRRLPEWEHTKPWHYLNVTDRGSVRRAAARDPDNVLAALNRFEKELADTSRSNRQRGLALRFIVHFVVDIHQPLHVGRQSDRGGNLVPVLVADRETNLHAVWDGEPLRRATDLSPGGEARRLPRPSPLTVSRWQEASALDWARESKALRPQVYAFTSQGARPVALSAAYLDAARTLADRRLLEAGVRLAGRLNALVGPTGGCGR
jgi:S1/P1 Nuclease